MSLCSPSEPTCPSPLIRTLLLSIDLQVDSDSEMTALESSRGRGSWRVRGVGGDERELREAGVETNHGLFSPPLHGRECSHTALTSHPNPPQLKDPLSPTPPLQGPAAASGATGASPWQPDQAITGMAWGCFKVFYCPQTGPDSLILVMLRGPVD